MKELIGLCCKIRQDSCSISNEINCDTEEENCIKDEKRGCFSIGCLKETKEEE